MIDNPGFGTRFGSVRFMAGLTGAVSTSEALELLRLREPEPFFLELLEVLRSESSRSAEPERARMRSREEERGFARPRHSAMQPLQHMDRMPRRYRTTSTKSAARGRVFIVLSIVQS